MHRDLKAEATQPPSVNLAAQQRRFERWRHTYNHERPHESLDQQCPAEFYQPSTRRLNENDKPVFYPTEFEVKTISENGQLAHEGRLYHVGEAFAHKRLGLRLNAEGQTELHFANVHLGNLRYTPDPTGYGPSAFIAPARAKASADSSGRGKAQPP